MPNTIPQDQDAPQQLGRLAAQRCLYSRAKRVVALQLLVTMLPPLLWAVLVAVWSDLKVWAALSGVLIAIFDALCLDRWQKSLKQRAANIQELFDTEVLQLPWRDVMVGQPPDTEDVVAACRPMKRKDASHAGLRAWYPPAVGALPLHLARIVCQRANCRWDATLRKQYRAAVGAGLVLLIISVVLIGFIGGMTVEKLILAVVAPLVPSILWSCREIRSQTDAAEALDKLKSHLLGLWDGALRGGVSAAQAQKQSREVQDEIYRRRRLNPVIFDWIYRLRRPSQQEEMTVSADQMVSQYLESAQAQGKG